MNIYYLMHNDDNVAILQINDIGKFERVKVIEPELIPPQGALSVQNLKKWWENRAVPITQKNIKNILNKYNIDTPVEFLYKNLGLSLQDHYWIKPIQSDLSWKNVNLFQNKFEDITNGVNDYPRNNNFYTPASSLTGELKKKWIIGKDNCRYLIKESSDFDFQQSINECFASFFHEKQNFDNYVFYEPIKLSKKDGKTELGCVSKSFTSIDYEFITAYDISLSQKKNNNISEYEHIINICAKNGLKKEDVQIFLEYQILSDYIMTNTDRHFKNFGVLRDTNTLKYVRMAPIFDSGNSMFWDRTMIINMDDIYKIETNSFKTKEIDMLKYINNKNLIDFKKLPSSHDVYEFYTQHSIKNQKSEIIASNFEKKVNIIKEFARGHDIFQSKSTFVQSKIKDNERER